MTLRRLFATFILSFVCFPALSESYNEAREARNRGDFEKAIAIFSKLSERGDKFSTYALADIYLDGKGVDKDTNRAISLFKKSIRQGMNVEGYGYPFVTLGWIYQTGIYFGVAQDIELAKFWNNFGAHYGHPAGYDNLAQIYAQDLDGKKNYELMLENLIGALENYEPKFKYILDEPDEWHVYVTNKEPLVWQARSAFLRAARYGSILDKQELLNMRENLANKTQCVNETTTSEASPDHSVSNQRLAEIFQLALSGDKQAQLEVADILDKQELLDMRGNPANKTQCVSETTTSETSADHSVSNQGIAEIFQLALSGDKQAQLEIANAFETGSGLIENSVFAYMWYNIAQFNGAPEAKLKLNQLSENMTMKGKEEAQLRAITCLESNYTECGWSVEPPKPMTVSTTALDSNLEFEDFEELRNYFFNLSLSERKKIQYALAFFGLYNAKIDGLWGNGTITGLRKFKEIQNLKYSSPKQFYNKIVEKVPLPSRFPELRALKPKIQETPSQNSLSRAQIEALRVQREIAENYRRANEAIARQRAADRLYNFGMQLAFPR